MADNNLPPEGLSGADPIDSTERRTFLRRAVVVGMPVVLATVSGRTVLAQTDPGPFSGGCASMHMSGWRSRNEELANDLETGCDAQEQLNEPGGLKKPGGLFDDSDPTSANKPGGSSNKQVNPGQ